MKKITTTLGENTFKMHTNNFNKSKSNHVGTKWSINNKNQI